MTSRGGLVPLVTAAAVLCACGGQGAESMAVTGSLTRSEMVQRTPERAAATTEPEVIADLVSFTSPSGNVGCYLDQTTVRCDISERDWSPPPRPADCELD